MKKILLLSVIAILTLSSFTPKKTSENPDKKKNEIKVTVDEIVSLDGPDVLNPNDIIKVVVEYSVTTQRDIKVFLQSTKNYDLPWALDQSKTVNGKGVSVFEFKVPRLPNCENCYRWGAFVTTVGGGYAQRVSEESFIFDVDIFRVKKKKKKKD